MPPFKLPAFFLTYHLKFFLFQLHLLPAIIAPAPLKLFLSFSRVCLFDCSPFPDPLFFTLWSEFILVNPQPPPHTPVKAVSFPSLSLSTCLFHAPQSASLHLLTFTSALINTHNSYRERGDGCDKRVDEHWGDLAGVVRTGVWLREGLVMAEEALDMHGEGVRVLKVVSQQHRPSHNHQLEIKHYPSVRKPENER